jgi:hypothetical protein
MAILFIEVPLNDGLCRHGWYHFRDRCYMFAKEKETWTNAEVSTYFFYYKILKFIRFMAENKR